MAVEGAVAAARRLRRQRSRLLRGALSLPPHRGHRVGPDRAVPPAHACGRAPGAHGVSVARRHAALGVPTIRDRWGVITYLVASSLVDLAAYMGGIVSDLSVPSAAVRIVLAVWLVLLQRRGG